MTDTENIQGHPRSFVAAYAKDLTSTWIESHSLVPSDDEIMRRFEYFADFIYQWTMQDLQKDMTDSQYNKLLDLFETSKAKPELIERIKGKCKTYTIQQASQAIQLLMDGGELPLEYQDGVTWAQKDIMRATAERAQRDK